MYSLYILKNSKNHLYVGTTNNVVKRIVRHNTGHGAKFTKQNKEFILVYEEKYQTLIEARRREIQIKRWSRAKKEAFITGNIQTLIKLSNNISLSESNR